MIVKCPRCGYEGPLRDEMQTLGVDRPLLRSRVLVPVLRACVWCAVVSVACGVLRADPRVTLLAAFGAFVVAFAVEAGDPVTRTWGSGGDAGGTIELYNDHWRAAGLVASGDTLRRGALGSPERMRAVYRACVLDKWSARVLQGVDGMSQREARDVIAGMVAVGLLTWRDDQPNHPEGALLSARGVEYGRRLVGG